MKRVIRWGAVAAVALAAGPALAQTNAEIIERALLAAPANARADATVVHWSADGTRLVLRQGSNDLVCWDQSSWPDQRPFNVRCTSEANLPRVEQNRELYVKAGNREEAEAMIQAAEKAGTRVAPKFGTAYYSLSGDDRDSARPHVTIAVPGATTASLDLPSQPVASGVWIMNAGTTAAHLMIPGR